MVFFALVTAWRLAGAPTRISPLSAYATIEGVVRAPSLFSMTLGLPPSMMATQELVVPRSMPMIFAMFVPFVWGMSSSAGKVGFAAGVSSFRPGYNHQRRPDDALVEEV